MPGQRRGWLKGSAGSLLTLRSALAGALFGIDVPIAHAASILAVRVWPARDYTRITLELDRPLRWSQMQLSDPPRLVVDLEGLEIDAALRDLVAKIRPEDPYIGQVRVGQYQPKVARIVIDLKAAVAPQLFALTPIGNYRHRLVLDLYPSAPVDPLKTLLDETRLAQPPSASPARDPLADLLQRYVDADGGSTAGAAVAGTPASAASAPGSAVSVPSAANAGSATAPLAADSAADGGEPDTLRTAAAATKRPARRGPAVTRLVTIAIDPGHGGEDPGAVGRRGTLEKDVVLRIARLLRERIKASPGMRAYMTRDGDYFVPLSSRVAKARRVQADLLVSIHADAFVRPQARGASVYVLSERGASSSAARWLARRENASDLIGGVNLRSQNHEVRQVLLDMSTTAQILDSSRLGRIVLAELGSVADLHKPRVEQAGFAVLKAPDIPSILVETAFISNPQEERRLADARYQARIADAIFRGIRAYIERHPPAPKSAPV